MWCDHCRQDVSVRPLADSTKLGCPRCGQQLPAAADRPDVDGWEIDEQLRQIGRTVAAEKSSDETENALKREIARLDPPHLDHTSPWRMPARQTARRQRRAVRPPRRRTAATFSWLVLSIGTMGLVCGGILLGWSAVTGRGELWSIGLPVLFGGQVALVLGLLGQLERLWRDSRSAAAKLEHVDREIHQLHSTTSLIGAGGHSPGGAFYAHLAGGANPDLLLSDLKGQLDLLALKLAERR
jgi:hypothetical protein